MQRLFVFSLTVILVNVVSAVLISPFESSTQKTVKTPAGTIIGSVFDHVEYYRGIPFAQPPTGSLRLKPPVRLEQFNTVKATGIGPACPQMMATDFPPLFLEALAGPGVSTKVLLGEALGNATEDCLTISVMRPKGTAPNANLPVLFWIYGGGFQIGSAQPYNGSVLIPRAVAQQKPFILVAVNYRLGGFGFLGGGEILADGSANLGLLDQRMGLEWVADNIAAFGGNPDAVTIAGESAGSLSVFHQLALYDGNHLYKGRPLFRAAIMNSGSIVALDPVDGPKAQAVFDKVAEAAGCSLTTTDKLECLRRVDYATYLNATNSVPMFLSYNSIALSYLPRPDGKILTASTDVLAQKRKYALVPIIVGDMEDEGTLFSLFQANITTKASLVSYLNNIIFHRATRQQVTALVDTYPYQNGSAGSPFGTGLADEPYPEFKRLAAILGDMEFILTRRIFLETIPPYVPAWSFLATWEKGTPILGTFHTSDLPRLFYGTDAASIAFQDRYIAFINCMDPNDGVDVAPDGYKDYWPKWQEARRLIEFGPNSTSIIADDFRGASFKYIQSHLDALRY